VGIICLADNFEYKRCLIVWAKEEIAKDKKNLNLSSDVSKEVHDTIGLS
jgi:hypothetical protein